MGNFYFFFYFSIQITRKMLYGIEYDKRWAPQQQSSNKKIIIL